LLKSLAAPYRRWFTTNQQLKIAAPAKATLLTSTCTEGYLIPAPACPDEQYSADIDNLLSISYLPGCCHHRTSPICRCDEEI
jgi:hypothetical protein